MYPPIDRMVNPLRLLALSLILVILFVPRLGAQGDVINSYAVGKSPSALTFDGANIWVANQGDGTVTKVLASTGAILATYPTGASPSGIAFDGVNIWVTNNSGGTVTELLAATGAVVGTFPVGQNPQSILFDGTSIWVTNNGSGTVTKLLPATGATVGIFPVETNPQNIMFDGTNVWVANDASNSVSKLLASTGALVSTFPVGLNPQGMAFDGTNVWVAIWGSSEVAKLSAATGTVIHTYGVGPNPRGMAFDGANIWVTNFYSGYQFASTVSVLSAATGAVVGSYAVGTNPTALTFDGTNMWVANAGSNNITRIGPPPPLISSEGIVPLDSTVSVIQPGEWASIYGTNLASSRASWTGNFPTSLAGTSVKINGKPAYLSFVSSGQINFQAPDDTVIGMVPVTVTTGSGSTTASVTLAQLAPSFVLLDAKHVAGIIPRSDGSGAYGGGAYDILGPTGNSLGYPTVAAKAGDTVELFGVGFGSTIPSVPAGQAFSGAAPTTNPVNLLINSVGVTSTFAGLSGAGLFQINLTVPSGAGTGDVPLQASVGGVQTQSGVVISLDTQATGLTGYWNFTAQSNVYGFQSGASGQLTQSGNTISGQLSLSGTPCATSAVASGTVSGSALSMTLNENGQVVTFSGSVSSDGNSASGAYVAPSGGCTNGDSGTWVGTRQQ
ncbi:MAG TPA: IPT/TIG domain-containing protein [Bryobacteraceae bacterium]|jgi:uncharacterized protein (TIGR03437 family)|nr:IPT/TIG domain-containing protein [Bryobacteraceae bacterium]